MIGIAIQITEKDIGPKKTAGSIEAKTYSKEPTEGEERIRDAILQHIRDMAAEIGRMKGGKVMIKDINYEDDTTLLKKDSRHRG